MSVIAKCAVYVWKLNDVSKHVGKSVDGQRRMLRNHCDSKALNCAIEKYGYDVFEKEVVRYYKPNELQEFEPEIQHVCYKRRIERLFPKRHVRMLSQEAAWSGDLSQDHSQMTRKVFASRVVCYMVESLCYALQ